MNEKKNHLLALNPSITMIICKLTKTETNGDNYCNFVLDTLEMKIALFYRITCATKLRFAERSTLRKRSALTDVRLGRAKKGAGVQAPFVHHGQARWSGQITAVNATKGLGT